MRSLNFVKMHGCGNDYIFIDCFHQTISENLSDLAIHLSDRHYGIGSDGIVLILPSDIADLRMRMFNADGTEAEMCGNASRCVGKYAYEHGIVSNNYISLQTEAGIKQLILNTDNNIVRSVTVDMGKPDLIGQTHYQDHNLYCINMGNPHAVVFVDNLDSTMVHTLGPDIEHLPYFPNKTNVEFVQIINQESINMRVWERGTGETMACGTGACAAAVAAISQYQLNRHLTVQLMGGKLLIELDSAGHVLMTGPAEQVFNGTIQL